MLDESILGGEIYVDVPHMLLPWVDVPHMLLPLLIFSSSVAEDTNLIFIIVCPQESHFCKWDTSIISFNK